MLFLVFAVLFLVLYPYISFVLRRLFLIIEIKKVCRAKGIKYSKLSGGTVFSKSSKGGASFRCETDDEVITVKICGVISRRVFYRFIDSKHYATRNLRFQISHSSQGITYETRDKEPYLFNEEMNIDSLSKKQLHVILFYPSSAIVTYISGSEVTELSDGFSAGEGKYYTKDGFINYLSRGYNGK